MINNKNKKLNWIIGNPTINTNELSYNLGIHDNTSRKIINDGFKVFKTKKFQNVQLFEELKVLIKLKTELVVSIDDIISSLKDNKVSASYGAKKKYCVHSSGKTCSCLFVFDLEDKGEIFIISVDYLITMHTLEIRLYLDTEYIGILRSIFHSKFDGEIEFVPVKNLI